MQKTQMQGIIKLYGEAGFNKIQNSHICVVGIGGVGSWVAESLVRSGVGEITLIDMDEVCVSNINRQIHALIDTVGKSKVEVMQERLLKINPDLRVNAIFNFLTADSLSHLISKNMTYVMDCFDSLHNKCILAHYCKQNAIPLIVMGGAGGKIDPSLIQVADLNKSFNDSLLFRMRKKLKADFEFSRNKRHSFGILSVFSPEETIFDNQECEVEGKLDCAGSLGSASFITGAFAFHGVAAVLREISSVETKTSLTT